MSRALEESSKYEVQRTKYKAQSTFFRPDSTSQSQPAPVLYREKRLCLIQSLPQSESFRYPPSLAREWERFVRENAPATAGHIRLCNRRQFHPDLSLRSSENESPDTSRSSLADPESHSVFHLSGRHAIAAAEIRPAMRRVLHIHRARR